MQQQKTAAAWPRLAKSPLDGAILALLFCLSFGLFLLQFREIYLQYRRGATSTALTYRQRDSLLLPDVTVCPQVPFKEEDVRVFREEDYLRNAWRFEEIFDQEAFSQYANRDKWMVQQTRLRLLGLCYTFRYTEPVQALDFDNQLVLRGDAEVYFALHSPGEQLWFWQGAVPESIEMHPVDLKEGAIGVVDVHVRKSRRSLLSTASNPCFDYGKHDSFVRCVWQVIHDAMAEADCWTAATKSMFQDVSDIEECADVKRIKRVDGGVSKLLLEIARNPGNYSCMPSCTRVSYESSRVLYHRSTTFTPVANATKFYLFYDSTTVEEREQALMYDFPKLVAAVGGSLGLFMGFSLLSVLMWGKDVLRQKGVFACSPFTGK